MSGGLLLMITRLHYPDPDSLTLKSPGSPTFFRKLLTMKEIDFNFIGDNVCLN